MVHFMKTRFFQETLPMKHKLFHMILTGGIAVGFIIALVRIAQGENLLFVGIVGLAELLMFILLWLTSKYKMYEVSFTILCFTVNFLLCPVAYFAGGGIYSSVPLWFIVGIIITFLLQEGKKLFVWLILEVVQYVSIFFVSFYWPQTVWKDQNRGYLDIAVSTLIVAIVIGLFIKYQTETYQKAQRETVLAKEEAEAANNSKSSFLANMSHEIRTPMNAICGMADLLTEGNFSKEEMEYIRAIKRSGESLVKIINDILDFSKIESGKMGLEEDRYLFNPMLHDIINMIEIRLENKDIKLELDIDKNIPTELIGDEGKIRRIFINLMNNAVKFTEKGMVKLCLKWSRYDAQSGVLSAKISDTGVGIRESDIDKLFEAFSQVDVKRNRQVEGSGLGLAICKEMIKQMGGSIFVESIYGEGSTFSFDLPQKIAKEEPSDYMNQPAGLGTEIKKYETDFEAPDAKIAIVDDNRVNLKVADGLMKKFGFASEMFGNGYDVVEKLKRGAEYDIIFIDHMMPGMDGVETTKEIRNLGTEYAKTVPLIALTANAIKGVEKEFLEAGMDDYLFKPIKIDLLVDILKKWLPPDKIMFRKSKREKCSYDIPAEFLHLRGIDVKSAAELMDGDFDAYRVILKDFGREIEKKTKLISRLECEEDFKNYTIEIHSLKSTARLVGAIELSEQAAYLEKCGKAGEAEKIHELTSRFLKLYNEYRECLEPFLQDGKRVNGTLRLEKNLMEAKFEVLRGLLEEFNMSEAEALLQELNIYQYSPRGYELLDEIEEAVNEVDYDIGILKIEEMLKEGIM